MKVDYLDCLAKAGKLLNSTGNRLIKINTVLTMLIERAAIRNPVLMIRDKVTGRLNIELAPEMTEDERNDLNKSFGDYISRFPYRFAYELILSPDEAENIPFLQPERAGADESVFISRPIMGQDKNISLGLMIAFIKLGDDVKEKIKLLNVIADMLGFYLDMQDFNVEESYEPPHLGTPMPLDGVIGASPAMLRIGELVKKVSLSRASVFIRGESGVGKELIAKAIHKYSLRSRAPFVGVNCAALPDTLLESELFGHEKGAFTGALSAKKGRFELANGGTLFLDEIGDTSLNFQTKLLRVLQEGEFERLGGVRTIKVDVRVVCSTNVDIEEAVSREVFREDLFYRLNVVPIHVPPLRERREDIPALVNHFLVELNHEYGKSVRIREKDMRSLTRMDWPGNVRELLNFIHRAFVMERDGLIDIDTAINSLHRHETPAVRRAPAEPARTKTYRAQKTDVEREEVEAIKKALKAAKGVQVRAADSLGLSLRQLRYRIDKYGITVRKIWN